MSEEASTCCRLCLLSESSCELRSIIGNSVEDCTVRGQILTSLGIEIVEDDKVSTKICVSCLDKVHNWHLFKESCVENQLTLDQWLLQASGTSPVHIKEELPDDGTDLGAPNIMVKSEPVDEHYHDLPPLLMPEEMAVDEVAHSPRHVQIEDEDEDEDPDKVCRFCKKTFSSRGNKRKHEKQFHKDQGGETDSTSIGSFSVDESESGFELDLSETEEDQPVPAQIIPPNQESVVGLKSLQRDSTTSVSLLNLTKLEMSYVEKCKAMVNMHSTLNCACHNTKFATLNGLLSHLRSLGKPWFPAYTCYHCMVTLPDRSGSTRHYVNCSKSNLESLIKMSNLTKRSHVKSRLYQLYKCNACKCLFSLHEDFCEHVDKQHSKIDLPYTCTCGHVFTNLDHYKDHCYVSCLVEYYCDICSHTENSLEEFQKHAVEAHDKSEGFSMLQEDNGRPRSCPPTSHKGSMKRQYADVNNIMTTRRRSSYKPPILDEQIDDDDDDDQKGKPAKRAHVAGIKCPICNKTYSTNKNMMRHYRGHSQKDFDAAMYSCPDCKGVYSAAEWIKHKEEHKKRACSECDKVFQFESELIKHRDVHKVFTSSKMPLLTSETAPPDNKTDRKKYFCKHCHKVYLGYSGLYDHIRTKHPEMRQSKQHKYPKKCKECDRLCYTGASYHSHQRMHGRQSIGAATPITNNGHSKKVERPNDDSESYYTCKCCFKVFGTKSMYRSHMKCHGITVSPTAKSSPKKCEICGRAFESKAHLERHKIDEHDAMPVLRDELGEVEAKKPVYPCDECVETFPSKLGLRNHKNWHFRNSSSSTSKHSSSGVYCKACKVSFKSSIALASHVKSKHSDTKGHSDPKGPSDKGKSIRCGICGKGFSSIAARHAHLGWHSRTKSVKPPPIKKRKEPFKCTLCSAGYPNNTALQIHILEKHRNTRAIPVFGRCHTCKLDFATQQDFEQHNIFHSVNDQRPDKRFDCAFCLASFNRIDRLRSHIRQRHNPEEHRCSECDRVFDKATSLAIHLKVHVFERSKVAVPIPSKPLYACSLCSLSFELPKDLRTHTIEAHPF